MSLDLTQYDEDFQNVPEYPVDAIPMAGKHRVVIENVEFIESQYGGHSICWTLRQLDNPGVMKKWSAIQPVEKLRFLKRDLKLLGLGDLKRLSDLPNRTEELLGLVCQVTVKTFSRDDGNPGYVVYFDRRLKNPLSESDVPF